MHLRTGNVIESPFATVRLRQRVTKGAGSRQKGLLMAFQLLAMAERRWWQGHGPLALAVLVVACAGWSGVLDVPLAVPENPEAGPAVQIGTVEDRRRFERRSYAPWTPSVHRDPHAEGGVAARTVGRRRPDSRGGNLVLPEGRTVAALVSDAVTRSFREAGYRVLEQGAPDAADAVPVAVVIEEFWAWMTTLRDAPPRFEFSARLRLDAPLPTLRGGEIVCGTHVLSRGGASAAVWERALEAGVQDLVLNLRRTLEGRPRRDGYRCFHGAP